jgi:cell division transport system ATP-binding protein
MIQLFHVTKNYDGGVPALVDVTLKVDKGEFVFITGPSGAGKSTLLKLIFGSESPTAGHIILEGRNYLRLPPEVIPYIRRRITERTVFENVALSLKILGIRPVEVRKRVLRVLSYVRLQHRANFKPLSLSGGEQQRVAVARALVKEPAILLADEPTGNLDPELAVEMMELFKEVNNKGTTVVIATHDKGLLNRLNKRTVALERGRVVG